MPIQIDADKIQYIIELLEQLEPTEVQKLRLQTRVLGIIASIYNTGSIEPEVLINDMHFRYYGTVERDVIEHVVNEGLDYVLHATGLVFPDGKLTKEGEQMAIELLEREKRLIPQETVH